MQHAQEPGHRKSSYALLLLALGAFVWLYMGTVSSMVAKWYEDNAFTQGFLIAPIALWLAWQKRSWLSQVPLQTSWAGVLALSVASILWLVAHGTNVLVVEQFAVVAMVPALVLTLLGWRVCRCLLFPLAFLFFMVPTGREIVPWLVDRTADFATWALRMSGVPVMRSHVYISIPDGNFEVAKACSGVNFLLAILVLGALFAYLNYASWKKRALFVLAVFAVAVLQNGVRVYITIGISHLTHMQFGPGVEHVQFARIFSILVMLGFGWLGLRWRDAEAPLPVWLQAQKTVGPSSKFSSPAWLPAVIALVILAGVPRYHTAFASDLRHHFADVGGKIQLPSGSGAWQGPDESADAWRPLWRDGLAKRQGTYRYAGGGHVDAFVAVYGLGTTAGAEMISFENVLYAGENSSVAREIRREVDLGDGRRMTVREVAVPLDGTKPQLVWHWYMFGDTPVISPFEVKAREALAWVTRSAVTERGITLATDDDGTAPLRLQAFFARYPDCVASGFSVKVCGG